MHMYITFVGIFVACVLGIYICFFIFVCVCVFSSMFIGLKGDIYFVHWRYFCGGWDFNVVKTGGLRLVF